MEKTLIFIQTNDGKILYKCDTFWSASSKINYAKIYGDINQSEIDNLIKPFDYNIKLKLEKYPEKLNEIIDNFHGCKMGYRRINEVLLKDGGFSAKDDVIDSDLGPIAYTHEMIINGIGRPDIVDIRKRIIRENRLDKLL